MSDAEGQFMILAGSDVRLAATLSSDDDTTVFCVPDAVCDSEQHVPHDEQRTSHKQPTARRPPTRDR